MIAAAEKAIQPEHQPRLHARVIPAANIGDVPRQLPRSRIAFSAQTANALDVLLSRRRRDSLGKDAHHGMILFRALVPPDNVVFKDRFQIPTLLFRHLREMSAAVQALFFTRDREKNNRPW